jgi:hypothetical protein
MQLLLLLLLLRAASDGCACLPHAHTATRLSHQGHFEGLLRHTHTTASIRQTVVTGNHLLRSCCG